MPQRSNTEREKPIFSASTVLDALAESLSAIRRDDKLTFADMAAVLGKSEDQAGKYASGQQEMGVIAFARAKREWNGRFTGALDRLCIESRPAAVGTDRAKGSAVLKAALALSVALEDDDAIDCHEVRSNRGTLENARDAIESLLSKLAPREVA